MVTRAATAICEEQTDINNFLACLCFGTYNTTDGRPCSENAKPSPRAAAQWQKAQCQQLRVHGQGHNKYGSQSIPAKCDSDPATDIVHSLRFDSDFGSLVTSPNDMLFFAVWHNEVNAHVHMYVHMCMCVCACACVCACSFSPSGAMR